MLALWILGGLAAVLVLVCLLRVGIQVTLGPEGTQAEVRLSLFHLRVYPGKEPLSKAEHQAETAAKDGEQALKRRLPKIRPQDLLDAGRTLWPPLKRALTRTRRGVRIRPLELSVALGGAEDPAQTAQLYGGLCAALWSGMPVLESLVEIRDPQIHLEVDYSQAETRTEGAVGVSLRIGTLLAVALGVAVPALRWLLKWKKRQMPSGGAEADKPRTADTPETVRKG